MSAETADWLNDPRTFAALLSADFTMGVATAAFQIEGAVREDGRGPSTWDTFMAQPWGRILDGSDASIADDHYHRYREDVALMRELGIDSYRFSLAWPRIQPGGMGGPNKAGIAFYDRLLDELLAAGIRPMATLFHWDMPESLQHKGGWMSRDTASRFADYALLAAEVFGDRIDKWVTLNEPTTVTLNGYALGVHAPGATLLFDALPAVHHQLLGHGLAAQALRSAGVKGGIGITNVHSPVEPAKDTMINRTYAEVFDLVHNRIYADPVLLGRYPRFRSSPASCSARCPSKVDTDDLKIIAQPLDFYGSTTTCRPASRRVRHRTTQRPTAQRRRGWASFRSTSQPGRSIRRPHSAGRSLRSTSASHCATTPSATVTDCRPCTSPRVVRASRMP